MKIKARKPTHPGRFFFEDVVLPLVGGKDFLIPVTVKSIANSMRCDPEYLDEVMAGNVSITPELAHKIGKYTNTSTNSWWNMQKALDDWHVDKLINQGGDL